MASKRQRRARRFRAQQEQERHRGRIHRDVFDPVSDRRLPSTEVARENVTVVERVGGPQPRESLHRPRRHRRHEAAILLHDALRQAGARGEDGTTGGVTAEMVTKFIELVDHVGSPEVAVTQLVDQLLKQRDDQVAEGASRLQVVDWGAGEQSTVVDVPPGTRSGTIAFTDGEEAARAWERVVADGLAGKLAVETEMRLGDVGISAPQYMTTECALSGLRLADGSAARHPTEEEWETMTTEARRRKRAIIRYACSLGWEIVGEYARRERTSWLREVGGSR